MFRHLQFLAILFNEIAIEKFSFFLFVLIGLSASCISDVFMFEKENSSCEFW